MTASERRRFNSAERVALYLAADGNCQRCGTPLEPGWHGDHIEPYSAGGPTDVTNGQALCPTCNLKKGSTASMDLRVWQDEALTRFLKNNDDFLAVATPGAGKTTFAIVAAQKLIQRADIQKIIVVVPTAHLREQWAQAASGFGVQLDYKFANSNTTLARDFDGVVVTYATIAAQPLLWKRMTASKRTLVVLDEVHHAGEDEHLSWGPALKEAFGGAARRLLLSGTPFRSDGRAIPFVTYDEQRKCVPSYNYDYGTALADRTVVRPIAFPALDGNVRWRDAGAIVSTDLAETDETTLANAMRSAFDPDGKWIGSVLRRANEELTILREEVPDAGGLVIAADQYKARRYAAILDKITGEKTTVAISDDPDASQHITAFSKASSRWIVAVQMVSEGVDIKRLAVGVYASRTKTEMFFRQVVGRFVRMRSAEDETTATLFIPSIQPLLKYAQDIERTVDAVLSEQMKKARQPRDGNASGMLELDLVQPIDSSEALHHSTVFGGESFTEDELLRAKNYAQDAGMPASVTPAQVATIIRRATGGKLLTTAKIPASTVPADEAPLTEQKTDTRRVIKRLVGQLSRATGTPYAHIHGDLNRVCQDTAATATLESLNRRVELLEKKLRSLA
ncbi:DEAD/DEAH box helicase family protein [Streptomyces sp. M2CJ-2]|uniref:DEAD/DEAH box helicase family protein n=1 Tax=Streptomyces sp. M2CJ-2 TaxID=2803948 RepID=UPI0019295679|nr:DEAD/DEAH box helicase family protein [Streptomyces sp. M2CJ-2]MBL3670652.1 DEAD/DEAH box helicase family protein [Streptomyces sp. M2CJ-2]